MSGFAALSNYDFSSLNSSTLAKADGAAADGGVYNISGKNLQSTTDSYNKSWSDLNARVAQLNAYKGTSQFDQKAYDDVVGARDEYAQRLMANQKALSGGRAKSPQAARVLDAVEKAKQNPNDPKSAWILANSPDWNIYRDEADSAKYADEWLKRYDDSAKAIDSEAADKAAKEQEAKDQAAFDEKVKGAYEATQNFATATMQDAAATFDAGVQTAGAQISSQGGALANYLGVGGAGAATANAAAGTAASADLQRKSLLESTQSAVDKYVAGDTASGLEQEQQAAGQDVQKQLQDVAQDTTRFTNYVQNAITQTGIKGTAEENKVRNMLAELQNKELTRQQRASLTKKIIGVVAGAAAATAGVAATVLTAGAAAPLAAPLVAGGIGLAGSSLRN